MTSTPLILGGHSFIQQLGNDPQPSEATQLAIVAACLDQGITWFDTTYQPERLARLGPAGHGVRGGFEAQRLVEAHRAIEVGAVRVDVVDP